MGINDKGKTVCGNLNLGFGDGTFRSMPNPDIIDKVRMVFADVETEGKKKGYARAAAEYERAFHSIEDEYKQTEKLIKSQGNKYDIQSNYMIEKLNSLEKQMRQLESQVKQETKAISDKCGIPATQIQTSLAAGTLITGPGIADILGMVYQYKERKFRKAEQRGYLEVKKWYEARINDLKSKLATLKREGNDEILEMINMMSKLLETIAEKEMQVAELKIFSDDMNISSENFRKQKKEIIGGLGNTVNELEQGYTEASRVSGIVKNTSQILNDLDERFCKQTGLTKTDMVFLFLATGLQIARQYLLTNEKCRLTALQGDELVDKALLLTPPSWKEVLTQSVPYDAIRTGPHVSDTGLSGTTHRYRTLGHDPIFGWIFGTANIMTNSLTKTNFETYQVKNMRIVRHYPMGIAGMLERAASYSVDNPKLLAASVAKQAIHFGSDYFTKQGLPIPLIAIVDNDCAQRMLSQWHIDMWSITREMALTAFINQLIEIIHKLFCKENDEREQKLYEVRTKKIIDYSNLIATSSNMAVVALTHDMKKLDVGGMAILIYRLITDAKFIRQVKEDFIFGSYHKMLMGTER